MRMARLVALHMAVAACLLQFAFRSEGTERQARVQRDKAQRRRSLPDGWEYIICRYSGSCK